METSLPGTLWTGPRSGLVSLSFVPAHGVSLRRWEEAASLMCCGGVGNPYMKLKTNI